MLEIKSKGVFNSWAIKRLTGKLKKKKDELFLLEGKLLKESLNNKNGKESRKSKKLNKKIQDIKEDMIKMAKKLIMKNGKIVEVDKDEIAVPKAPESIVVPEPTYVGPQMPNTNTDSFNTVVAQNEATERKYREEQVRANRELQDRSQSEMMRQQQAILDQELARREVIVRQQMQQEQMVKQQQYEQYMLQKEMEEAQVQQEVQAQQEYAKREAYAMQQARQHAERQIQYVVTVECINERVFDISVVESEVEATMNFIAQAVDESRSIKLGEYTINGRHIISWYVKE